MLRYRFRPQPSEATTSATRFYVTELCGNSMCTGKCSRTLLNASKTFISTSRTEVLELWRNFVTTTRENMDEVELSSAQDVKAWYAHVHRELKSFSKDNCWFERMCENRSDWSQAKCGLCANPNPKLRLNPKSSRFPLLIFSDIIATAAATCTAIKSPLLLNCAADPLNALLSVCKVQSTTSFVILNKRCLSDSSQTEKC